MKLAKILASAALVFTFIGCTATKTSVSPHGSSQQVQVNQVEDAAIWIHPTDPAQSLIFISNLTRGVALHDADGVLVKLYHDTTIISGIDVMYGEKGTAVEGDIVIVVCQEEKGGVRFSRIDATKRRLTDATGAERIPVLAGHTPIGVFTGRSPKTRTPYFFVTCKEGIVEQYEISKGEKADAFAAKKVRELKFPSKVKAGVVDVDTGIAYFAAEKTAVFATAIEPDPAAVPQQVIPANDTHNTLDLTGLEMYYAKNGAGYLILVSQNKKGEATDLNFYERKAPYKWVAEVTPSANGNSNIFGGSGIAVTNRPLGEEFPRGAVLLKNRVNPNASEDYKFYSWPDIAGPAGLIIDTDWSPRK